MITNSRIHVVNGPLGVDLSNDQFFLPAMNMFQAQLSFEVSETDFDLPAQPVDFLQIIRAEGISREVGKECNKGLFFPAFNLKSDCSSMEGQLRYTV
nr:MULTISPECIES: hypothetical protein [Allobaculum]